MVTYAGIGSRLTQPYMCQTFALFAELAAYRGWVLRSGGATGADTAFYEGAKKAGGPVEIFLPHFESQGYQDYIASGKARAFCPSYPIAAEAIARKHHPAWARCTPYARTCHTRNAHILLGADLQHPVDVVVCWTPRGLVTGGTGLAIHIAREYGIPVYNTANTSGVFGVAEMLAEVLANFTSPFYW